MTNLLADVSVTEKFFGCDPAAPSSIGCKTASSFSGTGSIISTLLPNVLVLAGVIFFGLIFVGGFSMIAGAGKEGSAQDKAKASAAVTYGVIGFLLVVSAYFILQVVGVITGINFIRPAAIL